VYAYLAHHMQSLQPKSFKACMFFAVLLVFRKSARSKELKAAQVSQAFAICEENFIPTDSLYHCHLQLREGKASRSARKLQ